MSHPVRPEHRPEAPSSPEPQEDLGFDLPQPARPSRTRVVAGIGVAVALLGGAFVAAYLPNRHAKSSLAAEAKSLEDRRPRVVVVTPVVKTSDRAMRLPASIKPFEETIVYPRANGYVRMWKADIGDKVESGDVLAEIDTPELDQQLSQARAQLVQAKAQVTQATANRGFAQTTLKRYETLAPSGVASQQELEQHQAESSVAEANLAVANANVAAQEANLARLQELKSFARVRAPFAGTINQRMIDRGALVAPNTPLYKISSSDPVRVIVQVPQDAAPAVHVGVSADVTVREYGERVFKGVVTRSAAALDPSTRTMLTSVRVPNGDGALIGGMYAQVAITLPTPHRILELPATALMNDAKGLRVATVTPESKIHLTPVVVERDTGTTIEIAGGVLDGERIVKLASAELTEGREVDIATDAKPEGKPGEAKPAAK